MQNAKLCWTVAALALSAATVAGAQDTATAPATQNADATSRGSSSPGGWDSSPESRPHSWIPGTSYGYVGIGVGQSNFELNCTPGFSCDETDMGYSIFTGGKISRFFGVEATYVYLGKAQANGGEVKAQGIDLSLIGNLPLGNMFNLYAKVGGIYGWTDTSATAPGIATGDGHGLNWSYGAGAQLDLNRKWAIQADFDHYRFDYTGDNTDAVRLYSLNLLYKF